jgi:opacity protein-like surface antigen
MKKILLAVAALAVCAASSAHATTVSVRVSATGPTSLPRTTVTMPAVAPQKDGHDCPATTAGAALDSAVGSANWAAHWNASFGELQLDSIYGEAHPFNSHLFWAVYVDGKSALDGLCNVDVAQDDYVQYIALCDPFDPPTDGTPCFGEPLQLQAPARAAPGSPMTVTVTESQTDQSSGATTIVPSAGATVGAAGQQATTDAGGHAALTLTSRGPVTVTATKGNRVDDSATTCVSDGADGSCGTTAPTVTTTPPPAPCVHDGDDGRCGTPDHKATYGFITSIREHQRFRRGHGPRELGGTSDPDPSGLRDVQLRLTRNDHGRCATFSAAAGRFVPMKRCGAARGAWFSAGARAPWSYLLPSALPRGRYVLDVRTVDGAGNRDTKLDRTRNRVVFFVA